MSEAVVKKIRPYPIALQIVAPSGPIQGEILRLTLKGFIADINSRFLKVGEVCQVSFELPVSRYPVAQGVVVMKTFDRRNLMAQKIDRLAEFHFGQLNEEQKKNISLFLAAIHQNVG